MEETKQILKTVREHLEYVTNNIAKLKDLDINISLDVGTDKKTVSFNDISFIEFKMKAKVQQDI